MQYNQEDQFEEIFRRSLDQPASESASEKDWTAMKQLLVKEKLLNKKKRKIGIYFFVSLFAVTAALLFVSNLHTLKPEEKTEVIIATGKHANTKSAPDYQLNPTTKEPAHKTVPDVKPEVQAPAADEEGGVSAMVQGESPVVYPPAVNGKQHRQAGTLPKEMPAPGLGNSPVVQGRELVQDSDAAGSSNLAGTLLAGYDATPAKDQHSLNDKFVVLPSPIADSQSAVQKLKELSPVQPDTIREDNGQKSLVVSTFYTVKKWGVGLYIAPENSYYEARTKANQDLFTIADQGKKVCNTLGINLSYSIAQNFYVQSGAWYSQKPSVSLTESYIGFSPDTIGSPDTLKASFRNYTMQYQGRYLEIPLSIKYYCRLSNTMRIYGLAGMIASFNMPGSKSYFIRESYDQGEIYRDRVNLSALSVGLAGHFAMGLEMQLNNWWSLYAEPFYKYSFSPVLKQRTYKNIPVEHFNRSWGAGFGIIYHFNKIKL